MNDPQPMPAPAEVATPPVEAPAGPPRDERKVAKDSNLVLDELTDRLDSLKLLREDDPARADALLEQFGAQGKVESQMIDQLGVRQPLAHPERFEEAHRGAMRALEVFDRNAAKAPSNLPGGPLAPLASFVVQMVIGIIVRSYQSSVISTIRQLYAQRQASSHKDSPEYAMLRLARRQADRLAKGLTKRGGGLPAFLVGGAVLSAVTSVLQEALHNVLILFLVAGAYVFVALAAFWCVLKGAALARRRTRIALDQPLRALWETIGNAGSPPQDKSRQFGIYAGLLFLTVWVVVPAVLAWAVYGN